jgi:hypothetical protein
MKITTESLNEAIILRELIDIFRSSDEKLEIADSIDVICHAMARIREVHSRDVEIVDWDNASDLFDQLANLKDNASLLDKLNKLYNDLEFIITIAKCPVRDGGKTL